MKILHITFSLNNAGKENMLVDIANEQQSRGNDVAILVINNSFEQSIVNRISKNIIFYKLSRKNGSNSLLHVLKLVYFLNVRFRPNVIHSHDPGLGFLLKFTNFIPLILTVHGPAFDTTQMRYYKKRIAVSEAVKNDVESRSGNKCEIIYNGVNINSIKQRVAAFNLNDLRIISVGRLDHLVKGQDLLIEAARDLVVNKGMRNIKFYFAGEGSSKEYLQELVIRLKLDDNVFLLGNQTREWIYENLLNYDLFVQPSRMEGFGLSVAEAMAARVPVIASDIEGPAEILEKGKHGILFENDNSEDLVLKIEKAMKLIESGEILKFTDSAYAQCTNNFNIAKISQDYCETYSS